MSACYLAMLADNTIVIELRGLRNSVTKTPDTGAIVAVTIKDDEGASVTGVRWPVMLSHDSGGNYLATLSPDVEVVEGHSYTAHVSALGSGGEKGNWRPDVKAVRRLAT